MRVAESWFEMRELENDTFQIWEPHVHPFARCNIWFVRGSERDLLVDSGTGLRPLTPVLSLAPGRPLIALATHIHFDHVGSHHEFADRRAHSAEAYAYATMPGEITLAPLFCQLESPVSALPHPAWTSDQYRMTPAPIGITLEEGVKLDLGDRTMTVLHLPGHSSGSIGLFEERSGALFSGDALYDGQLTDNFATSDVHSYCATMERLNVLQIRVGHGGHGPSFDNARKTRLIEEYLAGKRAQGCPRLHGPQC